MEVFPEEHGSLVSASGNGDFPAGRCVQSCFRVGRPRGLWNRWPHCQLRQETAALERVSLPPRPSAAQRQCWPGSLVCLTPPRCPLRRGMLLSWSRHPQPSLMVPIVMWGGGNLQQMAYLHHRLMGLSSWGSEPVGSGASPSRGKVRACGEPKNPLEHGIGLQHAKKYWYGAQPCCVNSH